MTAMSLHRFALVFATAVLSACLGSDNASGPAVAINSSEVATAPNGTMPAQTAQDPTLTNAQLPESFDEVFNREFLAVGQGVDAPGRLEFGLPKPGTAAGPCATNTGFLFGAGLHDITGPVANTGGAGWEDPMQILAGLHMRQYSRAFALESPCDTRRLLFVSADVGLMFGSIRHRGF